MEKYTINGYAVEYDTFDLDEIERWDGAIQAVSGESGRTVPGEGACGLMRRVCGAMLDFFDTVLGPGTARAAFGDKVNVKDIAVAYRSFTSAVSADRKNLSLTSQPAANRAQRRAAKKGGRQAVSALDP